ncbi:MAG: InlB B-repeat-containing protein [Clostridia bacterium]|nr:InlB B-repeat-containing protein [Clostridia bacterium]
MATTRNRTYRVLAWALAIALTVLSLPIVPFTTWSSNLTNAIGDSMSINAHAYSMDNRPRVGAWWWHKEDGTNATTRENYLQLLEDAGITEVYYYAGWDFSGKSISTSTMSEIHTFVQAAMQHGIATSFLMDDLGYMKNMGNNFVTYRNTYPNDWAYGFHFDYEVAAEMKASFPTAVTNFVEKNIYVEYDFNPAWGDNSVYTDFVNRFKGGKGCMHLMAYRTASAQAIFDRAQEVNNAVTLCKNNNCDVVIGMECTLHESDGSLLASNVSLARAGKDKNTVVDYIRGLYTIMANTGLTSDFGVAIHHARSFSQDISGDISANRTTSYNSGGVTESRTTGSYVQTTATTKNTSGMTLTKKALYYKANENKAVAAGGEYVNADMISALVADYQANGMIDPDSGEYYEIIMTGTENSNGNYVYAVLFDSLGSETWSDESTTAVSTSLSTISYKYPNELDFSTTGRLRLYDETGAGTFTVKSIEVNAYRWTSGGGDTPTSPTSNSSASSSTTKQVTTTTQSGGGGGTVSGNLIVNGDFSNGTTGWTFNPASAFTVSNGKLNINTNYYKSITANASFSQVVGNGKTYTLRVEMSGSNAVVKIHNKSGDGSGARITITESGDYTFTVDSGVSSDASDYRTRFDIYVEGPKNTDISAIFDNFVLVEGTSIPSGEEESSVTPTTYTVTVTGGTTDKATAAAGDTVTITAGSPATGYKFKNWTGSGVTFASATSTVTTFTMPASNVTVTANYEKINYTVSVTLGTASKTSANYGDTITLTANAAATGMEFDKWVVKSGSTAVTFASATSTQTTFSMPAGNVSVEATYKAKTYTVTVSGGTASPTTQMYNNTVTITANSPQTGYKFKNWTTSDGVTFANANNATTTFTMPAKNVTVTANFEKINYTVSVTGGTASKTTANVGDTITLTPGTAPSGKVFDKWTSTPSVTFTGNTFTMPASNVSITATYKNAAYTVTVNNGSASPAGGAMGDTITITANAPATGKVFDKWTTSDGVTFANASSATTTFTLPAKNVTVTATYKDATYSVSVTYGTANPTSAKMGATVSLTAQTRSGYVFDKWTSSDVTFANANSSSTTFTMPAKNVSVTATYKQLYTVSVTGGTASPSSAVAGTEITLTPESRSGWAFSNWSSSDVTVVNNKFTMPSKNVSVTANFTEVIVDPDPPATPTLVSATADGYNVIFKWNAVSGAAGYRVYRKTGSGAYATVKDITGGTTATFTDEALAKGTYTYTVQAYVNGTSGKIWGDYNATGKSATVTFGAPVLTSAVASASGITVTWQKVNGATGYRLYRKDGTNWVTVKTIADANTVSYLAKGLIAGQTYTYTVQAYYDSTVTGLTQWSDYDKTGVSATAEFGTPETEGQANGMKITINWEAVSGAEGYRIYRKTADTSWRTIATVDAPNTTYTDDNPVANVYYTYTVQAFTTEDGVKIYSTYDATGTTARVVLGTPTLSEAEVTGEGVVVSWEAVTGATGYRLYRWNGTAWKTVKTVIGINTTSYTDRNANAVAGAKYTVQAFRNADGVNVWSDHSEAGVTAQ